jgi:hypothetical protein
MDQDHGVAGTWKHPRTVRRQLMERAPGCGDCPLLTVGHPSGSMRRAHRGEAARTTLLEGRRRWPPAWPEGEVHARGPPHRWQSPGGLAAGRAPGPPPLQGPLVVYPRVRCGVSYQEPWHLPIAARAALSHLFADGLVSKSVSVRPWRLVVQDLAAATYVATVGRAVACLLTFVINRPGVGARGLTGRDAGRMSDHRRQL